MIAEPMLDPGNEHDLATRETEVAMRPAAG